MELMLWSEVMAKFPQLRWTVTLGATWLALAGLVPVLAQSGLTLSQANPTATASGTTVGVFPLANVASRDHRGLICTGFADTNFQTTSPQGDGNYCPLYIQLNVAIFQTTSPQGDGNLRPMLL